MHSEIPTYVISVLNTFSLDNLLFFCPCTTLAPLFGDNIRKYNIKKLFFFSIFPLIFYGTFRNNSLFFFFRILISKQIAVASLLSFPLRIKTSFCKNSVFFDRSGMYRKHPNHTYGRNRNNSANNQASIKKILAIYFFNLTLAELLTYNSAIVFLISVVWIQQNLYQLEFFHCNVEGSHDCITSVPEKRILSAVVYYYCAWYSFFRNGR